MAWNTERHSHRTCASLASGVHGFSSCISSRDSFAYVKLVTVTRTLIVQFRRAPTDLYAVYKQRCGFPGKYRSHEWDTYIFGTFTLVGYFKCLCQVFIVGLVYATRIAVPTVLAKLLYLGFSSQSYRPSLKGYFGTQRYTSGELVIPTPPLRNTLNVFLYIFIFFTNSCSIFEIFVFPLRPLSRRCK